ncbi:MAG TPA: SDR family oxidoreductase [Thioploca sp.]|nr:SDR family oxidoreductase [Thioploca sp.]
MENSDTYELEEESIAIVGLSGRFPGAKNIDEFWHNLKNGVESITFFSDQELLSSGLDPAVLADTNYVKAKGILDNVAEFDAAFFDFNPKEAEIIDPQQRLFLECAWEALENAGYDPKTYSGAIGVYGGVSRNSYLLENLYANPELRKTVGSYQILTGNDKDFLCTRVSYKLNLSGPSITVQTACSTSLVAVVMGCKSLLDYQCDMVLAGGVSISLPIKSGYLYQEGMIMSPDGHCRAFDAKAQGTVGGNGVGIVVLKRLEDALNDGDTIHAVIKGAAINNDGALKIGYTAPSVDAQARVIVEALTLADISPETISYVEAHGTATPLGDPVEIAALKQAFQATTDKQGYCAIGSAKTNIGHLDTAAGVASLIKTVLALKHQLLPPSLHFETPNPKLDLANSPFYVNAKLSEWKTNGFPRRAGVSSFGIGGTNAHVVLEEAPKPASETEKPKINRPWQLLLLSAKTDTALETATTQLLEHLKQHPDLNLADVAYTYQVGRHVFDHCRLLVCQTLEDAVTALETREAKRIVSHTLENYQEPSVVFMFSGQGTQYVNMGLELYQTESVFREYVDRCAEFLKPHLGLDLRTVLYPTVQIPPLGKGGEQNIEFSPDLKQTAIAQPALFVIEYALAQLWMAWGVQPKAMIGHSIGEYVAACLAGVFTLEEALMLVAARGRLMQSVAPGAMLAVPLSEQDIRPFLNQNLNLSAINVPVQCVVSGTIEAVAQFAAQLAEQGIECQHLHTSHAFHSEMMSPILERFLGHVQKIPLKLPKIPFISNVTGTWMSASDATSPDYWATHLRKTVRFAAGLQHLLKVPHQILLEIGPGRTLSTFAKRHPDNAGQLVLTSLRHPKEQQSDSAFLLNTLGQLWMANIAINWSRFYAKEHRQRLSLPTYPFERQRYWVESNEPETQLSENKKSDMADWFYVPSWKPLNLSPSSNSSVEYPVLVFVDEWELGSQLVKQLALEGEEVVSVKVGEIFTKLGERFYSLNPEDSNDYHALIKELEHLGKIPKTIVHCWNVTQNHFPELEIESFERFQNLGFYSLIFLVQALKNFTEKLKIAVVSNHLYAVKKGEPISPEKTTVLGAIKTISQEYHSLNCRHIDVFIPQSEKESKDLPVNQILSEIQREVSERIVAYRGTERWVQTFTEMRLEEDRPEKARLREGGVYLITGGLGRLGLLIATHLAKTVHAKLILTGRSILPAKNQWSEWLDTHNEQDSISGKIRKVQQLEELGAEVLVVSADVANLRQMENVIAQAEKQFEQLNGVIHAAGLPKDALCLIQNLEQDDGNKHFQSKAHGALVLSAILQERELDFCLLMSSLSSVIAGPALCSYAAANQFLDAFAYQQNQSHSIPWMSVNWDNWSTEQVVPNKLTDSINFMTAAEGSNALQRILCWRELNQFNQIVVSTTHLQPKLDKWVNFTSKQAQAHSTNNKQAQNIRASQGPDKKPDIADWFYIPSWKRAVISPRQLKESSVESPVLVFIDECGLGSKLGERLEREGQDVISVKVGEAFTRQGECLYTLNPDGPNDYEALLQELSTIDKIPTTIVHCWRVTPVDNTQLSLESLEESQNLGLYSLIFLAQALGKQNVTKTRQMMVISNNMHAVTGEEEALCPEKATLLGPVKIIPLEYFNLTCCHIDVILPQSESQSEPKLIDRLIEEHR